MTKRTTDPCIHDPISSRSAAKSVESQLPSYSHTSPQCLPDFQVFLVFFPSKTRSCPSSPLLLLLRMEQGASGWRLNDVTRRQPWRIAAKFQLMQPPHPPRIPHGTAESCSACFAAFMQMHGVRPGMHWSTWGRGVAERWTGLGHDCFQRRRRSAKWRTLLPARRRPFFPLPRWKINLRGVGDVCTGRYAQTLHTLLSFRNCTMLSPGGKVVRREHAPTLPRSLTARFNENEVREDLWRKWRRGNVASMKLAGRCFRCGVLPSRVWRVEEYFQVNMFPVEVTMFFYLTLATNCKCIPGIYHEDLLPGRFPFIASHYATKTSKWSTPITLRPSTKAVSTLLGPPTPRTYLPTP